MIPARAPAQRAAARSCVFVSAAHVMAPHVMAALALACGSRLPPPPLSAHVTSELIEVSFPPPPARVELVPEPPPAAAAMWIDGEWTWRGRKWGWRAGYWTEGGAGLTYSPWQVTRDDAGTLYFAPGAWHDADGGVVESPPPLRLGHARAESVVTPEGETEPTGPNVHPDGGRLRSQDGGP
jgi:hypothetical protein